MVALLAALGLISTPGSEAATAKAAAKATTRTPITTTVAIMSGGRRRTYLLVRPAGPTTGIPMFVFLSGRSETPSREIARDNTTPLAANGSAVLVYPAGYQGSYNTGEHCCGQAQSLNLDDVDFVRAVVADVQANLHTDPKRVYLGGYSNGGKLAMTIACIAPRGFAAFAVYGANPTPCSIRARAPYFIGDGGEDTSEPINGKKTDSDGIHAGVTSGISSILSRDNCHGAPAIRDIGTVVEETWASCTAGALTYADWTKEDHEFPRPPYTTNAESAGVLMWNFLINFKLRS